MNACFDFNITSVNIRGLNDGRKRRNVFRWLKKNKTDLCLMQETYSTPEVEDIWRNEWGGKILYSHGTNHARGVMILVNPRLDITIKNIKTDDIGRIIIADVTIQDTPFNIVNIYSPNSEGNQVHFFNQLNNI